MQIFYFLVILTTALALPFPEGHNEGKGANQNPEVFDGDMLGVREMLEDDRNGRRGQIYRWPNAEVPYVIERDIDDKKRKNIKEAMAYFERKTCVTFVPRTDELDYIRIHNGTGCTSWVGRQKRYRQPQAVSLANGCEHLGSIMHELMHAVGFFHEHGRVDRDQYLEIHLENVDEGDKSNFNLIPTSLAILYNAFDYDSIMIYDNKAFSKNGLDTMVPLQKGVVLVDAALKKKMTKSDIKRINKMYECVE